MHRLSYRHNWSELAWDDVDGLSTFYVTIYCTVGQEVKFDAYHISELIWLT